MNKLLTPNGGLPIFLDDLAYTDSAVRDALKGVIFEIAAQYSGNMILGGCELTNNGTTVTVASGYLLIEYEVCVFAGTSFPVASGTTGTFSRELVSDIAGNRTWANGTSSSPWQTRRAIFTPGTLTGGVLDYSELKRLKDGIYSLLNSMISSSSSFSMLASWAKPGSNPATLYKHHRQITMVGDLQPGTITTNTWTKITTLPAGFRPVQRLKTVQMGYNSTPANGVLFFDIFTNGEVYAQASGATSWDLVSVNVSFIAA